mmetsp:Transcript_14253/g.61045  ORF Transcript_14253/g.61045 Transcript_14253/m.61045 type:complete len:302 (+) Transcript_14253:762-1667(+)
MYKRIGPESPASVFQSSTIVGCSNAVAPANIHPLMMSFPSSGSATRASRRADTGRQIKSAYAYPPPSPSAMVTVMGSLCSSAGNFTKLMGAEKTPRAATRNVTAFFRTSAHRYCDEKSYSSSRAFKNSRRGRHTYAHVPWSIASPPALQSAQTLLSDQCIKMSISAANEKSTSSIFETAFTLNSICAVIASRPRIASTFTSAPGFRNDSWPSLKSIARPRGMFRLCTSWSSVKRVMCAPVICAASNAIFASPKPVAPRNEDISRTLNRYGCLQNDALALMTAMNVAGFNTAYCSNALPFAT